MMLPLALGQFNRGGGAAPPGPTILADADMAFATVVAGNVTALPDQSGTGDAAKNLANVGTIVYTATDAAYNNAPTCLMAGAQRLEGGAWAVACAQPFTVVAVGEGGRLVDGASGARGIVMVNAGLWSMYAGSTFVDAAGSNPAVPTIIVAVFNGASSAIYISDMTTPDGTGNPGTDTVTQFTLGALTGGGGELSGKIARVVIYSGALDAAQRATVRAALGATYGL